MNLNSISALLEALKRSQSDSKSSLDLGGDDAQPIAAKLSVLKAVPSKGAPSDPSGPSSDPSSLDDMDDMSHDGMPDQGMDSSDGDDDSQEDETNEKIVNVLQADYPSIYAKISKQVGADDSSSADDSDAGSSLADMMPRG